MTLKDVNTESKDKKKELKYRSTLSLVEILLIIPHILMLLFMEVLPLVITFTFIYYLVKSVLF